MVKELRDKTGAGMMDCKSALTETGGDLEAAVDWLRTKGLAKAAKKAGRVAAEGLIGVATAPATGGDGRGQFRDRLRARNADFQKLVNGIAEAALDDRRLDRGDQRGEDAGRWAVRRRGDQGCDRNDRREHRRFAARR